MIENIKYQSSYCYCRLSSKWLRRGNSVAIWAFVVMATQQQKQRTSKANVRKTVETIGTTKRRNAKIADKLKPGTGIRITYYGHGRKPAYL